MQKTIVATLAAIATVTVAAASDLPSKTATPVAPAFAQSTDYYVGYNAGVLGSSTRVYSGGAVAGWNALPFLAVEGTYTYNYDADKIHGRRENTHTVAVNALPQYRIPGVPVTAYAIVGAGYRWDKVTADHTIYNYGAGAKYALTKEADIDLRYTRTTAFDTTKYQGNEDRYSIGFNYKF
jgi:opacity protein-like surface antigen